MVVTTVKGPLAVFARSIVTDGPTLVVVYCQTKSDA
jgi:hypothetical protein